MEDDFDIDESMYQDWADDDEYDEDIRIADYISDTYDLEEDQEW